MAKSLEYDRDDRIHLAKTLIKKLTRRVEESKRILENCDSGSKSKFEKKIKKGNKYLNEINKLLEILEGDGVRPKKGIAGQRLMDLFDKLYPPNVKERENITAGIRVNRSRKIQKSSSKLLKANTIKALEELKSNNDFKRSISVDAIVITLVKYYKKNKPEDWED